MAEKKSTKLVVTLESQLAEIKSLPASLLREAFAGQGRGCRPRIISRMVEPLFVNSWPRSWKVCAEINHLPASRDPEKPFFEEFQCAGHKYLDTLIPG